MKQPPKRWRLDRSGDAPSVVQQFGDGVQRDTPVVLAIRLARHQHVHKFVAGNPRGWERDARGTGITLRQRRLGRLCDVLLHEAGGLRRTEEGSVFGGKMKAAVRQPLRPCALEAGIKRRIPRTLDHQERVFLELADAGTKTARAELRHEREQVPGRLPAFEEMQNADPIRLRAGGDVRPVIDQHKLRPPPRDQEGSRAPHQHGAPGHVGGSSLRRSTPCLRTCVPCLCRRRCVPCRNCCPRTLSAS